MIVKHGGEQIVCRTYGMKVACEMQVYILHRDDLRISAACGTALDAENGTERRLTQSNGNALSYAGKSVGETYRGCRFAFACGCRCYRRYKDELAAFFRAVEIAEVDFCLVIAVLLDKFGRDARALRYFQYMLRHACLSDFYIR